MHNADAYFQSLTPHAIIKSFKLPDRTHQDSFLIVKKIENLWKSHSILQDTLYKQDNRQKFVPRLLGTTPEQYK